MGVRLKKISEQVIVITGASSGIGLTTALMAAEAGARVVLASRNEDVLRDTCSKIRDKGGQAIFCVADVSDPEQAKKIAEHALSEFGQIDTWVNNAAVSIFGRLLEVPMEEKRRMFEVNFWGVVNGCRAAIPELKERGGALINIGSALSDRVIPIQGMYSVSKHAVKAYTDALRMELEAEGYPISVSLVKPSAINTPYLEHAQNHQHAAPTFPPPVYSPEVVARAILECAQHPHRDVFVGVGARVFSVLEMFLPRVADFVMEKFMMDQTDPKITTPSDPALFRVPSREGQKYGPYRGHVASRSLYTDLTLHKKTSALAAIGIGILAYGLYRFFKGEPVAPTSIADTLAQVPKSQLAEKVQEAFSA